MVVNNLAASSLWTRSPTSLLAFDSCRLFLYTDVARIRRYVSFDLDYSGIVSFRLFLHAAAGSHILRQVHMKYNRLEDRNGSDTDQNQ